jgi:single-stranded-DNA-specific exonuclease
MVITDHHQIPNDINPDNCDVFINNQRSDSTYYKDVSGCFVAFLVMVNTYKKMYPNNRLDIFNPIIPYVAISTISDVMSLKLPINRHIVKTGLNEINSFRNKAWYAIKKILNITGKITYKEIGFKIAPLINTANRIDAEDLAFKLLSADTPEDVLIYGEELNKLNNFRKTVQKTVINKEKSTLINNPYKHSIVLLIDSELSISGIVASNIGESKGLPTVCFLNTPDQDAYVGSTRAIIKDLNIVQVFKNIANEDDSIFIKFGGHEGAAGCSIHKEKLEEFKRLFDKYCEELTPTNLNKDMIEVDMFLPEHKLTPGLVKPIESMGPYGKDWAEPVFLSVLNITKVYTMGTIAKIIFETPSGRELQGTHFFRTQHDININNVKDVLKRGTKALVSYSINLDNFRNMLELNLNIVYIKPLPE